MSLKTRVIKSVVDLRRDVQCERLAMPCMRFEWPWRKHGAESEDRNLACNVKVSRMTHALPDPAEGVKARLLA